MESRERSDWATAVAATTRAERAARGWTQDFLVEKSGLAKSTVRRIEGNLRVADITQIARLASAFGLTLTEFLIRAEERLALSTRVD